MMYNKDEKTGELYHYGVKGQRWGVRRYQNEDGSYTSEGLKRRYQNADGSLTEKGYKKYGPGSKWEKRTANRLYRYSGHTNNIKIAKKMVDSEYKRRSTGSATTFGITGAMVGSHIGGPAGFAVGLGSAAAAAGAVGLVNTLKAQKINKDFDTYYELNKVKGADIVNDYIDTAIIDVDGKKYKFDAKNIK